MNVSVFWVLRSTPPVSGRRLEAMLLLASIVLSLQSVCGLGAGSWNLPGEARHWDLGFEHVGIHLDATYDKEVERVAVPDSVPQLPPPAIARPMPTIRARLEESVGMGSEFSLAWGFAVLTYLGLLGGGAMTLIG